MKINRRRFTKSLALAAGALALPSWPVKAFAALLPVNRVTKIRVYYPPNYNANGPQAFPQSNMVVLVDTEAGITGIGQGGSPDTVRNVARSVIGKNAFDTEIDLAARLHGRILFARQGTAPRARRHRPGAVGYQGQGAQRAALQLFGGKAREHIELYATNGVPPGLIPQDEAQR